MPEIDLPQPLIDAQRTVDRAWAEVEDHRKSVNARRRAAAATEGRQADDARPWTGPALDPWTQADDDEHERRMATARAAAEARQAALTAAGLGSGYTIVQALHLAARPATV
ncbi:hypothetical protein [Actinacidiphila rubida]|uniref:Uncharacterized protein n=1 Tax=Actinacidiphila rubida TaxID=310780 RepID=A0A1H8SYS4_9ACTN|nr:hypothetical protein [Actinacidiphila rubida]SEO84089.1 hypothetical protein SAMN05216267_104685 [Actinacidiphila rubida]